MYTHIETYLRLSQCILYSIAVVRGIFNILRNVSRIRVVLVISVAVRFHTDKLSSCMGEKWSVCNDYIVLYIDSVNESSTKDLEPECHSNARPRVKEKTFFLFNNFYFSINVSKSCSHVWPIEKSKKEMKQHNKFEFDL